MHSKFAAPSPNNPPLAISYATAVSGATTTSRLTSHDNLTKLPENIQAMIDEAVQAKFTETSLSHDKVPAPVSLPENIQTLIDDAVANKLNQLPQRYPTQQEVENLIDKAINEKLSTYESRLDTIENTPLPEIPTTEFITTTISSEVKAHLKPLDTRVGIIETTLGSHTEQSNQRLQSLEEIIRQQNQSLNNFMAAMTASNNNHIPAVNSLCRVVAKTN